MKTCYIDKETRSIADLMPYAKGMLITRINVPKAFRGKGHARRLLARITADADAEGMTLFITISPSDGLGFEELEEWYTRRGFRLSPAGIYQRFPRRKDGIR